MNRQSEELLERLRTFTVSVIQLVRTEKTLPFSVIDQVIRSSSSIGANYAEAQNAASKQDFRNKIYISKKESAETEYWLSIIADLISSASKNGLQKLQVEAHEITMILQKIINTLRSKSAT